MTHTKLTRTLLAGMMTCSMALTTLSVVATNTDSVRAAEVNKDVNSPTFDVNLYKMKLYDGRQIENNGSPLPGMAGVEGLQNVTFNYYNITELFHKVKIDQKLDDNQKVMDYITDNWKTLVGQATLTGTTAATNADGLTTIADLPKKTTVDGNALDSIYLFEENASDANADFMMSPPFILGMTAKLAEQDAVTLYAKNYGVQKNLWGTDDKGNPVDLNDDSKAYSFEVGDDISYTSTSPIPAVLDGHTTLRFLDTMSTTGTDLKQIDAIGYYGDDGTWIPITPEFNAVATKHLTSNDANWANLKDELNSELTNKVGDLYAGFYYELDVNDPDTRELLEKIAGKRLEFRYTMTINDQAVAYKDIDNTFYGIFTNQHGESISKDTPPPVETGAHDFKKVDSKTKEGLKGAQFILRQGKEDNYEYAIFDIKGDNGKYDPSDIEWTNDPNKATVIESGSGGVIQLEGLAEGNYVLYETKAPTGYEIANKETSFTIKDGARGDSDIDGTEIDNSRDDVPLPITGSTGIAVFVVIGLAAMGTAVVYQKKRRQA
ncbi:SpaH/EbpB family LPXTG-anchored major pilin [Lacticaseibacillus sp. GG6-2]